MQASFTPHLKGSFLVTERVTRMHWKNAEGYQCYATWWNLASCSSTSPASGWTNSRPLQSQGPFRIGTSCVHMEVCDATIIRYKWLGGPWTTKLYCLLTLLFAFTVQILGFKNCQITADFYHALCRRSLMQCRRKDVSQIFHGLQLKAELYFSDLVYLL